MAKWAIYGQQKVKVFFSNSQHFQAVTLKNCWRLTLQLNLNSDFDLQEISYTKEMEPRLLLVLRNHFQYAKVKTLWK